MSSYQVAVAGRLPDAALRVFSDLGARSLRTGGSTSTVEVVDQAALVGLINRMHSLGIVIDHVARVE